MASTFATILIAELVGSAALLRGAGHGTPFEAREDRLAFLLAAVEDHGGRVAATTGDGLTAVFRSPAAAVQAAVAMQRGTGDTSEPTIRVGVAAGEITGEDAELWGMPMIVARRLAGAASGSEILVADIVRQIAGPRWSAAMSPVRGIRIEGLAEPVAAATLRWSDDPDQDAGAERHEPSRPITVVIADDQRLLRAGFRVILDAEPDITVVGEAPDGRSAVDVVTRRRPDVVLMDIRMPELDGLSAAERILSDHTLSSAVVMLTTFDASEYVYEALRIGASGFLLKDTPSDRLLDAVRVAAAGEALIAPSITRRLIADFARVGRPATDGVPPELAELTAREVEVLRLIARGLSNAEIAAGLVLSENTVKTHVARLLGKLGLRDRVQAVVLAYESGLAVREA